MATEEERTAILAEYMDQVDQDNGDDEEEFEGDYFDDDDDDDGGDGSDDYDDGDEDDDNNGDEGDSKEKEDNYAILNGNLTFNDEGKLIYSGTWSMKLQQQQEQQQEPQDSLDKNSNGNDKKKKKKTKFKLKSKRVLKVDASSSSKSSSPGNIFTLQNPLLPEDKPRSILFDGFFTTDETDTIEPYRKIKERDVEFVFSKFQDQVNGNGESGSSSYSDKAEETKFQLQGKGSNDFGTFHINGILVVPAADQQQEQKEEKEKTAATAESISIPLTCNKKYVVAQSSDKGVVKKRKRRGAAGYDSEDDYDFGDDGDEGADYGELIGLHEEAELSVEELRKRYYGGGEGDDSKGAEKTGNKNGSDQVNGTAPSNKKSKISLDDDDDDDGCGF